MDNDFDRAIDTDEGYRAGESTGDYATLPCGHSDGFTMHFDEHTEPHGEVCYQEWTECVTCGEKFDDNELVAK